MPARLATKLSFAEARTTLASFVPDAPSTEVVENTDCLEHPPLPRATARCW